MENVLAILLAGGAGERLYPLTRDTAKPAVPFGGAYRIIDFTLSNCINSNVRQIFILTQYKSLELIRHVRDGWNILSAELGEYIEMIPPMKRVHGDWYQGTADAVFQNFQSIEAEAPDHHPDPGRRPHLQDELPRDAGLAPGNGRRISRSPPSRFRRMSRRRFGVAEIDEDYRIVGFEEKPDPADARAFAVRSLDDQRLHGHLRLQHRGAAASAARGCAGPQLEPRFRQGRDPAEPGQSARVVAYDFRDINAKQNRYWRDVGTLDAYYEANMDLVAVVPEFNLYDRALAHPHQGDAAAPG